MLVSADAVITMDPRRRVLEPGWLRVEGRVLTEVGAGPAPVRPGEMQYHAGLVLPGFVSAHQHLLDVTLRGTPVASSFLDWLLQSYYRGLSSIDPEGCAAATEWAIAECLRSGITTIVDCWGIDNGADPGRTLACAEASLDAHRRAGNRVVFGRMFAEHVPRAWRSHPAAGLLDSVCAPADRALSQIAQLACRHHGADAGRIRITPSPELPEMVSPAGFHRAHALARELGTVLPVHLFTSPGSRAENGPLELAKLGVFDDHLLGAHCTAATDRDVVAMAVAGVRVAHCPTANLALGSPTTPVASLRRAGVAVGLGLDNASLNPRTDLVEEARAAVLVSRAWSEPIDAADALVMATIDGAAATGLADLIGSIEVGKRADLVLVDTDGSHWWPRHDWPTAMVGQFRPSDVRTVIVDGRVVVDDGQCTMVDPLPPTAVAREFATRAAS